MKFLLSFLTLTTFISAVSIGQDLSILNKSYSTMLSKQASIGGVETPKIEKMNDGGFSVNYKCTDDEGVGKDFYTYFFDKNSKCTTIAVSYKSDFEGQWRKALNKRYQYGSDNVWFSPALGIQITADIIKEVNIFILWYMPILYSKE